MEFSALPVRSGRTRMNKTQGSEISRNMKIVTLVAFLFSLTIFLLKRRPVFPDQWFPSHFTALAFTFILFAWLLSESINNLWSLKNSQKTNQDKGSRRIIVFASYTALLIAFMFRIFKIGIFNGGLQYIGIILIVAGIILREWSIWVLGKYFTARVQVSEKAKLVTQGPYKYIRHPAYCGYILSFVGTPLAVGT
jgi:protein-S-isoprenylcysteine O-methyltransferase Ste14